MKTDIITNDNYSNNYLIDRTKTIDWLKENNYPVLPVAPAQDAHKYPKRNKAGEIELNKDGNPQQLFTGKNPSYLDVNGTPHLINHSKYQYELPTDLELKEWFTHANNGVGTLGGWNNTIWLDIDVKKFHSQEDCDNAIKYYLEAHPEIQETFTERTHSGGYRIGVIVKQQPGFTNFALEPDGVHIGEALGQGRFTVLAPTVGNSGNAYHNVKQVPLIEVESLASIGIYPVKKKNEETKNKKKIIRARQVANTSVIQLELLGSETSQTILKGNTTIQDRSDALTTAIKEWYGWENWCNENKIDYSGKTEELAQEAGVYLGIDSDRVERIIDSVDPDDCHPATLFMGDGDESNCWLKILQLDKNLYKEKCPNNIKQEIKQNSQLDDYESAMNKLEKILKIQDIGRQMWEMERLSKGTRIKSNTLIDIYKAKLNSGHKFVPIDVLDFLANTSDERDWIVAGHISIATTIVLFADGGVGKTLLTYDICKAVATGQSWNGFRTKQGKVLIIQTDEPEIDTKERLYTAGFSDTPKGVIKIETKWQFSQISQLRQWIEHERPVFVVIDSLTSANRHSSVEEKDASYGAMLYDLRDIANEYKCSIMVLHHENKAGGARGTTAIRNNVSEVWRLYKGESTDNLSSTQRILEIEKSRSGCTGKSLINLDVDDYSWKHQGNFGEDNVSKSLKDKLLGFLEDQPGREFTAEQIATQFSSNRETIRRNLEKLRSMGFIDRKEIALETNGGKQKANVYFAAIQQESVRPYLQVQS